MSRKQIGSIEEDVISISGMLLGGYFLVKNLLPDLLPSIGVSAQDKATLDGQQTTGQLANIFNAGSQQSLDWSSAVLPNWGSFDNFDDYLRNAYANFVNGSLSPDDPIYPTMQIYYALYKGLIGHLFDGDQAGINAAMDSINNKWQVGIIANLFSAVNGQDFWTLLRNGQFTMIYGLNGTDLASQVLRLNALPD